jgi:hypothetical protein
MESQFDESSQSCITVRYLFDDGTSAEYWGLFEEGKRVRYTV